MESGYRQIQVDNCCSCGALRVIRNNNFDISKLSYEYACLHLNRLVAPAISIYCEIPVDCQLDEYKY